MLNIRPLCPRCGFDAIYRYGHTWNGKKRYLCLICNRQFVLNRNQKAFQSRPLCPKCRGKMYIYKREQGAVRFRCADYPLCRGYEKQRTTVLDQEVKKA